LLAGACGWFATGAWVGLAFFLWKRPSIPSLAVGEGAAGAGVLAGAAGVVAGEAAAVACFLDRFFGVALAAGVALVTAASALGLGLALCDRLFGVAEAAGLGVAFWEYASGVAAIANRARSERNVRIKHVFYLDLMPVGNPGSVKKGVFWGVERPLGGVGLGTPRCKRRALC
jgi:hypothetical protein